MRSMDGLTITFPPITFDSEGYPTEEALEALAAWEPPDGMWTEEIFHAFMEHIRRAWWHGDALMEREGDVWFVSTGGWSGNEELVDALLRNVLFRALYFAAYRRGGHYVFCRDANRVWFTVEERDAAQGRVPGQPTDGRAHSHGKPARAGGAVSPRPGL